MRQMRIVAIVLRTLMGRKAMYLKQTRELSTSRYVNRDQETRAALPPQILPTRTKLKIAKSPMNARALTRKKIGYVITPRCLVNLARRRPFGNAHALSRMQI